MSRTTTLRLTVCGLLLLACAERRRAAEPAAVAPPPPAPRTAERPPEGPYVANCGGSGMPDCPLQAWMDSHLNNALSNGDFPAVARGFKQLAADPPPAFSGWARLAEAGVTAAEKQDQGGVRATCDGCHAEFRERYRATIRGRPVRASDEPR